MSVTIYGQHAGDAIFEDDNGWARIPLRVIPALSHAAAMADAGYAAWAGRRYDRDDLAALRNALLTDGLPRLDSCAQSGCDEAAPFDNAQARPLCHLHAKEIA